MIIICEELMKRVYPDWGIVSYLKKEEYDVLRNLLLSNKDRLFFVYSSAHFEDLMRSKGEPQFNDDIQMLSDLVGDHLLDFKKEVVWPYRATPEVFNRDYVDYSSYLSQDFVSLISSIDDLPIQNLNVSTAIKEYLNVPFPIPAEFRSNKLFENTFPNLQEFPTLGDVIESCRQFMCEMMMNGGYYKSFRKSIHETGFKLDANAGNWSDEEATNKISLFLKSKGIDMSFNDYVKMSFHGRNFTANEFFTAAYCILDMLGFHSDKLPKACNTIRSVTTDAKHAYFAGFCDWFVTADTRLYHKAKALYNHLGVATRVMTPREAVSAIKEETLPYGQDYILSFIKNELIPEHIVERHDKENDSDAEFVIYRFSHRFLGIFTHGIYYLNTDGSSTLQIKLIFENYSRFLFYDEVAIIMDTITDHFGLQDISNYDSLRKKFIEGDTAVTISWRLDNGFVCVKNDEDRHRPELYIVYR